MELTNKDINGFHFPTLRKISAEASKKLRESKEAGKAISDKRAFIDSMREIKEKGQWNSTSSYEKTSATRKTSKTVTAQKKYSVNTTVKPPRKQKKVRGKVYRLLEVAATREEANNKLCAFEDYARVTVEKPRKKGDVYKIYGRKTK